MKAHIYRWCGVWKADIKLFGQFVISGFGKTPSKAYSHMQEELNKIGQHRPAK